MGTPYETTGARSRLSGLSCRPQGSDVRPQGQPVRPRGHIRPSQALSDKGAPGRQGVPWQAKRPVVGQVGPLLGLKAPCHTTGGPWQAI